MSPYFRGDDALADNDKVEASSRGVVGIVPVMWSHAARKLTDGHVPDRFVRRYVSRRGDKRLLKEAVEVGFLHPAGDLCERCLTKLREAETAAPTEGFYLHDYLEHNPNRREVEARRARDRAKKAGRRAKGRQGSFAVDPAVDPTLCPPGSSPQGDAWSGEEEVRPPTEATAGSHAGAPGIPAIDDALAVLRNSPRLTVDDIIARTGVENALGAYPDRDVVMAAREVVGWTLDPTFESTDIPRLMLAAMRKQPERPAGTQPTQRSQGAYTRGDRCPDCKRELKPNEQRSQNGRCIPCQEKLEVRLTGEAA